jgi:HK97 gp10 family phage protein
MSARAIASFRIDASKVAGVLAKVGQGLYDGVETGADLVLQTARQYCPVLSGQLVGSIDVQITRGIQNITGSAGPISSSAFGVTAIIAPHTDYDAYVEFGTGQRGAASTGAGEGPYKESWPGMVAQPYMRPACDTNREAVIEGIKTSVADAIQ